MGLSRRPRKTPLTPFPRILFITLGVSPNNSLANTKSSGNSAGKIVSTVIAGRVTIGASIPRGAGFLNCPSAAASSGKSGGCCAAVSPAVGTPVSPSRAKGASLTGGVDMSVSRTWAASGIRGCTSPVSSTSAVGTAPAEGGGMASTCARCSLESLLRAISRIRFADFKSFLALSHD